MTHYPNKKSLLSSIGLILASYERNYAIILKNLLASSLKMYLKFNYNSNE